MEFGGKRPSLRPSAENNPYQTMLTFETFWVSQHTLMTLMRSDKECPTQAPFFAKSKKEKGTLTSHTAKQNTPLPYYYYALYFTQDTLR